RQGAAGLARMPGQAQCREIVVAWSKKFERWQFGEIQWRQCGGRAIRPRYGVLDGETHVGITQWRKRGTVCEFHHGMDDTLRVDYHFHAPHLHAKKPVRLDHFQSLVESCGRIDRDL